MADLRERIMLRLVVLVGVDLLGHNQTGVAEDELAIPGRDAEVLEQGRSRVPEVMKLDRPYAAGSADALTFTDEQPPVPDNPVAPARRSPAAQAKASGQQDPAGQPYRSFRGLLEHLATLTRNQVRFTGTRATVPMLAEPTSTQREAFRLLGVPIPLTLK
jgi:hypothetical protein